MFVHASRIQKQFEYLQELGIDLLPLLKQTGIRKDEPFSQDTRFEFEQYKLILEYALRQSNNPDYGLDFGNQSLLGGTIGMMSASCSNLKEAFIQGCKFLKLQGDFADLEFVDDSVNPKLVYSLIESWTLDSPATAKLEVDAMFSFLNLILKLNSGGALKPRKINLTYAKPDNLKKYQEVFGIIPVFEAGGNEMVFDKAALMIPMKAYNPETRQVLSLYLESQLDKMTLTETLAEKVKRILHSSFKYQFPDMESVAEKLNLSARTMQRKLSDEKTSFKDILQETRFGIAKQLLKQDMLTISEISYTLGYSDLGNFSRSFKKYAGVSPQMYRSGNKHN